MHTPRETTLDDLHRSGLLNPERHELVPVAPRCDAPGMDWDYVEWVRTSFVFPLLLELEQTVLENMTWLKGSVGEGPNRTNYCDQSSVGIEFSCKNSGIFARKAKKSENLKHFLKFSTFSKMIAKFPQKIIKI